ncbi:hypothetical protein [Azospirillum sp. SYSU D00513]|uniref:hypothetical protein n=1 Tax=Azospirillum sp. SYSU D00513 TaxID=2812561 RepID=UPI001A957CF3|nr:hypothetical protein [Azospirillum sp. SYSU D00513]
MSSITQVGSYASYLSLVRNLSNGQQKVDQLSQQLTTGVKSVDLNGYGAETQKLLELRAEMVQRTSYVQTIDTAAPRVKATDVVLEHLEKLASDWQSNNLMPFQPGPPTVNTLINSNPEGMKVKVNTELSSFTHNAKYTVSAVPSDTGPNGTYDITLTDGLGGRTMRSINLATVPPSDGGGYNFEISGGIGDGAVVNLDFENLQAAASSSFEITWPQANETRERAEGALRDIQQMLNERFGDRYLFGGSRYATEPVGDLLANRQTSKVTFNGSGGQVHDVFEVTVGDRRFMVGLTDGVLPLVTPPNIDPSRPDVEPGDIQWINSDSLTDVANALKDQMQKADPALPLIASAANGIITLVGNNPGDSFNVSARVQNSATIENSFDPVTSTGAVAGGSQTDSFTVNGGGVDIGDTFEFTVTIGDPDDVNNQKYYNENPDAPHDLPTFQEFKVSYTVTPDDYQSGAVTTVDHVADKLRGVFDNLSPKPPVTINPAGSGAGITLTSDGVLPTEHANLGKLFSTSVKMTNGSLDNTVTVATLPPEAVMIKDIPKASPPDLPFYDTEYLTKRQDPKAWEKAKATVDDGFSVTYGVVSTDPAFQTLINAFRAARAAASNPGKYEEYVSQSRELMSQAKDQLRSVHAKLSSDAATLEQKKTFHKDSMATVTERIAGVEGIDQTEVATRLSNSMNALEAAYTVAGRTQKLSLLNYLA